MQVFARYALARRYHDRSTSSLLLEGSWPRGEETAACWSLDDEIDARYAWIDALASQFAERLAIGGPEALAHRASGHEPFPAASLAYLNALKLRYYLVRLLRVVVFCRELCPPARGEPLELFVERGRDDDYARLFSAVCRATGSPLQVHHTSAVADNRSPHVANAIWRRLAAAAQQWTVSSPSSPTNIAGDNERIVFCGNPRLLDPTCAELLGRGCTARWVNDRFAFGTWRQWRKRGVVQFVLNTDRGKANRFSPATDMPSIECLGVDLAPTLAHWLNARMRLSGARQTRMVEQLHQHMTRFPPTRIVLDEDATVLPRATLALAHPAGAVSTVVQHGAPCIRFGFAPLEADRIAVWGETTKRQLHRWSVPDEKIHVTGSSYHEKLLARSSALSRRPRGADGPRILLAATVPAVDARPDAVEYHLTCRTEEEMLRAVFTAVGRLRGSQLTVRLHPRAQGMRTLSKIIAEFPGVEVRVSRGGDLAESILASDCVVSCSSGAGVDAVLLGVPVIGLLPSGSRELLPHGEWGFQGTAQTANELKQMLTAVLRHGDKQHRIDTRSVSNRGGSSAAEQIADAVLLPNDAADPKCKPMFGEHGAPDKHTRSPDVPSVPVC